MAVQACSIVVTDALPNRRTRRLRDSRNVLSKFATDAATRPASGPTATSVAGRGSAM